MFFINLLQWWYGAGWSWITQQIFVVRLARVFDFFSIKDLARTLFAPFRQDAIDTRKAPIGIKMQVLGGNIISRVFGFLIRTVLIIVGIITMALVAILGVIWLIVWPLIPLGPLLGIILFGLGVSL